MKDDKTHVQAVVIPEYEVDNYVDAEPLYAINIAFCMYGFFNKLFPVICEMR